MPATVPSLQQLHHAVDGAASGRTDAADDLASLLAMLGLVMCSMDAEASQRDEAIVLAWLNARAGTSGDAERVGQ